MKSQLATSKLVMAAAASLLMMSFTAKAELKIQSAQYKAEKDALFVKGKFEGAASTVYVIDANTSRVVAEVGTQGKHFREDIAISVDFVPCMVQIQTNNPRSRRRRVVSTDPGEFGVSNVRHAPGDCSN